jgi:hypothetical protein
VGPAPTVLDFRTCFNAADQSFLSAINNLAMVGAPPWPTTARFVSVQPCHDVAVRGDSVHI